MSKLRAVLAIGAVVACGAVPNAAQARDYPFCIVGADYDNAIGECSFDTYAQCQASASGRFDFCQANPFYADRMKRVAHPGKARAHSWR